MFSSNKKETSTSPALQAESSSRGINSLGEGTSIKGDLNAQRDMRIDGTLHGNVNCGGKLILGPKGKVIGEINCENAVIEGQVEGHIKVKDTLQVKLTGKILADIACKQIVVESGAQFNGKCEMGGQKIASPKLHAAKSA